MLGITEKERISNIDRLAKKYGITIVLKGSTNLVSCSIDGNGNTAVIKRSTPAMTVGGTGDVLSGLTAGLLTKTKAFLCFYSRFVFQRVGCKSSV